MNLKKNSIFKFCCCYLIVQDVMMFSFLFFFKLKYLFIEQIISLIIWATSFLNILTALRFCCWVSSVFAQWTVLSSIWINEKLLFQLHKLMIIFIEISNLHGSHLKFLFSKLLRKIYWKIVLVEIELKFLKFI